VDDRMNQWSRRTMLLTADDCAKTFNDRETEISSSTERAHVKFPFFILKV